MGPYPSISRTAIPDGEQGRCCGACHPRPLFTHSTSATESSVSSSGGPASVWTVAKTKDNIATLESIHALHFYPPCSRSLWLGAVQELWVHTVVSGWLLLQRLSGWHAGRGRVLFIAYSVQQGDTSSAAPLIRDLVGAGDSSREMDSASERRSPRCSSSCW